MRVIRGAPPSYRDEIAKLNVTSKRARRDLENGFPVATESHFDSSRNTRVYTVCTPYGEKSTMTLMGTDLPRRTSNMCPVILDETLMNRDPATPSELFGQFLIDPTRVPAYAQRCGIEPYDYANKALHHINSLPGGYVDPLSESDRISKFDCMQRTATAVFSYDIATPHFGPENADSAIVVGDLARVWDWSRMAKMPLQDSLKEVFCEAIGAKKEGSFEERLDSSKKRIRDLPVFYVTDTTKQKVDFTELTRIMVLTMSSIPCILSDSYLKQINEALYTVYPLNETPTIPRSIFHEVSEDHRDGCGDDQVAVLQNLVRGHSRDFNNVMKIVRESKQRLADTIAYHRHLACSRCGQDATSMLSIQQEVTHTTTSHCDVPLNNVGKFVSIQTKANRCTYSLNCCRQVRITCKEKPQYDKGDDRVGVLTREQSKNIYERPCTYDLEPTFKGDIDNQRATYKPTSCSIYVLVPFDLEATLERLKEEGVEDPQAELLTLYNVVECIVPIFSQSGGATEYRFKALVFRGKLTISVQAHADTAIGEVSLFDPESTTKRLSLEMLGDDGEVRLHRYVHQLKYNGKRYLQTQGTLLSMTNFKQYKSSELKNETPIEGRTNWDKYGYTLVGAMAANWVRCAQYAGRPLLSPECLRFGVVSDTREQTEKPTRPREHGKRKREAESRLICEEEARKKISRLQSALEEERRRTCELSDELNNVNLRMQLHEWSSEEDKKEIEELRRMNQTTREQYLALEADKDAKIKQLENCLNACKAKLAATKRRKRVVREEKSPVANEPVLMWLPEYEASVLTV